MKKLIYAVFVIGIYAHAGQEVGDEREQKQSLLDAWVRQHTGNKSQPVVRVDDNDYDDDAYETGNNVCDTCVDKWNNGGYKKCLLATAVTGGCFVAACSFYIGTKILIENA